MKARSAGLLRWLQEPLVHFIALGAAMFVGFHLWGDPGAGSSRIVVTSGRIEALATGFLRTWQRAPTDQELKGLIDEFLREELAAREALAMGLDRDDTIIRRRLRQKLEFLAEDTVEAAPPTDAELQAWLDAHPEIYRREPSLAFRQVFLSPNRRGQAVEADALRLRQQLAAAGPDADLEALGDSLMLPRDVALSTRSDIVRLFGSGFAEDILKIEPGVWSGPIRSGYGVHIVLVRRRQDGDVATLADVRSRVERDFLSDRRRRHVDAMYSRLLGRYRVVIEPHAGSAPAVGAQPPVRQGPRQ